MIENLKDYGVVIFEFCFEVDGYDSYLFIFCSGDEFL